MDNNNAIIVFGTPTCPMIPPVIGMLKQSKVPYTYIDISKDNIAHEQVRAINQGNASVPTLIFPDGTTLTEPSGNDLKQKLETIGYRVPFYAWITGYSLQIIIFLGILFAILRGIGLF